MRVAHMHHIRRVGKNKIIQVYVQVRDELQPIIGKKVLIKSTGTPDERRAAAMASLWAGRYLQRIEDAERVLEARKAGLTLTVSDVPLIEDNAGFLAGAFIAARMVGANHIDFGHPPAPAPSSDPVPWEPVVDFWVEKNQKLAKAEGDRKGKMRRLFGFLGHNDMGRVTPDNLQDYLEQSLLPMLRPGAKPKQWKTTTVEDHVEMIKAMFRFAYENRKITTNPAKELRYVAVDNGDRDEIEDFTTNERATILRAAIKAEDPFVKFGNLIAGFLGARVAEIAEAHTNDIEVRADGTVVLRIQLKNRPPTQRIKTGFSRRNLPLPPGVTRHGFLEYVAEIRRFHDGEGPLFPHLKVYQGRLNTDASKRVNEFIDDLGIKNPLKRFHSWRHTIATLLTDDYGVPEVRARHITGHAPRTKGERYIKHHIPQLVEAIWRLPDPTQ